GRRLRPGDLRAAGDGIGADSGAEIALPAETLILDGAAFRLGPDERWIARAVRLAEGVPTGNERDGLLVVHRHAKERLADVLGCGDRSGLAIRSFRVDVDEAHLHRAERLGKLAFAAITLIA